MMRLILLIWTALLVAGSGLETEGSLTGRVFYTWRGNIYSWLPTEAEPIQHTTDGYYRDLAISPDSTLLAYTRTPTSVIDQYDIYYDTKDLWVLDLRTGEHRQIAVHPADADTPEEWVSRSGATWSPDGTRLAYTEWEFPRIEIRIYTLATGTTEVFSDTVRFGYFDGSEHQAQEVDWGGAISKSVVTYFESGTAGGTELSIYDKAGGVCAYALDERIDPSSGSPPSLRFSVWVLSSDSVTGDTWQIGLDYGFDHPFRLMDYRTGEQVETQSRPAISALLDSRPQVSGYTGADGMVVTWGDGTQRAYPRSRIAYAPNGEQIAVGQWDEDRWTVTVVEADQVVGTIRQPNDPSARSWFSGELVWAYPVARLNDPEEIGVVEPYLDHRECRD